MISLGIAALVSFLVATQFVAHKLGYHDALGRGLFTAGSTRVYAPWAVLVWYWAFGDHYADLFASASVLGSVAGGGVVLLIASTNKPGVKAVGQHAWGTLRDAKRAALLAKRGTVIGRWGRRILMYDGPSHQLVAGAARSGKTAGHAIPTLLTWPESVVVYDIKGELWQETAGFRSTFSHTAFFNPTTTDSIKFNPLLEVRRGDNEIRDVQNIVTILVNPTGEKRTLDIWDQNASQFLVALILHVLYTADDGEKNLGTVRDMLLDFDGTCRAMAHTPHRKNPRSGQPEPHPECRKVAVGLLKQADRFRSSVLGTAESYLTLFADPVVRENTSRSDLVIGDLMCAKRPVSLYLQPPPSDADRVKPLTRLLFSQFARALMENLDCDTQGRPKLHRLLFLMDEFPTLGRLAFFETNMRQMAGYKLKASLLVQSFNDIAQAYGPHNAIIDNCHIITAFASADTTTQQRVSQMTGTVTEYREGYSQPRQALSGISSRRTVSFNEQVRPLLNPGQVRMLGADEQLVFVTGVRPLRTKKVRYYQDRRFKERCMKPPDQSAGVDVPVGYANPWLGVRSAGPPPPIEPGDGYGFDDIPMDGIEMDIPQEEPGEVGDPYGML